MKLINSFNYSIEVVVLGGHHGDPDVGNCILKPGESQMIEDHWDVVEVCPVKPKSVVQKAMSHENETLKDRITQVKADISWLETRLDKVEKELRCSRD